MSRFGVVFAVVAVGCAAPPGGALESTDPLQAAKILSPGCSGSGYTTVQSAINAAAYGDTVEVCPGTYSERLTISGKTLTLKSRDGAATTTIDAKWLGKTLSITGGSDVVVDGLTFLHGSTTGSGANVYCSGASLELRNSVLSGGTASKGGGLGATTCDGIVEYDTFADGTATFAGGGAWIVGDLLPFENNVVTGNDAVTSGGGLYLDGDSDVVDNTFDGNHSDHTGGGVYVNYGWGDLTGNTVTDNTTVEDGAGIYVYNGAPVVSDNTFERNDASDEGGGLRFKLSTGTIRDNVFTDNHADYRGGAMKVSHKAVTMSGNVYVGNDAWVSAGAVLLYESASTVSDEIYTDNHADYGGAMTIQAGWANVLVQDTTFDGNSSDVQGGQLWINLTGHTTTLRRVDLSNGWSDLGGAVYAVSSDVQFENTAFDHNDAWTSGGAMYFDTVTGDVLNDVAYWNDAPAGAAITFVNGGTLNVKNSVFRENWTGSALSVASGTVPTVKYSDFYMNTANFGGMSNVVGLNGNLAVSTAFVDQVNGDYHLTSTSGLKDKGDPGVFDTNGSRSDMGIYGGPQGW